MRFSPPSLPPRLVAIASLMAAALFWSGNFILAPIALQDLGPIALACGRWWIAAVILLPLAWPAFRDQASQVFAMRARLTVLALFGIVGFTALSYVAFSLGNRVNPALIMASTPLMCVAFGGLLFRDALSGRQIAGASLGVFGIGVVSTQGFALAPVPLAQNAAGVPMADLAMIGAVICFSIYAISQRWRGTLNPIVFMAVISTMGAVLLTPLTVLEVMVFRPATLTRDTVIILVFLALCASVLGFVLFQSATEVIGPAAAAQALHLVPLFTVCVAVLWFDEPLEGYHLVALALVMGGIVLSAASTARPAVRVTEAPAVRSEGE